MRRQAQTALGLGRICSRQRKPNGLLQGRCLQINATPSSTNPSLNLNIVDPTRPASTDPMPDAQFEVLGSPFSLLSASISASQNLYARKGTLVGFNGKAEDTVSTLSLLEPFRRAITGIPFIYQKISSTTPFTALISTKSPITTFAVVHLDGRLDWMIAQRNALLAWTGHTLSLRPRIDTSLTLAHWGHTRVTGRGLLCLSGKGQVYQIALKTGEEYVVHPSNVVAYNIMQHAPQPYRFKSSALRFQIPSPASLLPDTRFFRTVRESQAWRFLAASAFTVRTWARRSIWGDRMFLRFEGPANILLQSRGNRLTDSLTTRDVNEIADTPAGAVQLASSVGSTRSGGSSEIPQGSSKPATPTKMSYAEVGQDGAVKFGKS